MEFSQKRYCPVGLAMQRFRMARQNWRWLTLGWTATLFAGLSSALTAEEWPQFRGLNASGISTESVDLPIEFSAENNVLWSADVGEGIGSPVISRGAAFATSMSGDGKFVVLCYDGATGEVRWRKDFETGPLPAIMPPNTPASSTPAVDGERLYVYFSTLGLMALDVADGEVVWKHPIPLPQYLLGWGAAHSPVVYQGVVLYCQDDDRDPFLLAVDAETGKERWKTPRSDMLAGYATPVICSAGGQTDVVIAGSGKLKGYDLTTGKERWTCNSLLRTVMTSPVVADDTIYISIESYGDGERILKHALLEWKDTNQDGKLDKTEVGEHFWPKFDAGDSDHDGLLADKEIEVAFQAPSNMVGGGNTIQAVRGGGDGDVTESHLLWKLDHPVPSNIASPLVVAGQLFVVKKGGISSSFDSATGKTQWIKKRIRNMGNYYASPIAGDGKIYVAGENGTIVVLKQGPELEVLGTNDMGETCIATPAIADNRLYIRTLTKLYCIASATSPNGQAAQ